ncbi:NAD-dependent epimerase/dehydratase family protein [Cytobacillus dafuensis]|uniref:NAD-dependent epimerase/dehydratase family protein n=1 Tax=Cytobacillus dafuensis TaxID=1742359 RepID=A0A5B8Z569_CYTDA|nr:NAD-dependent epimerase/dehydratase family protein [Cytobacillus dafuensis]QED46729.1 NAD-dependent epimerase/dehydratase family protein [Cytobacillus dafuensis]
MKTAAVLGATGGMGNALTEALIERNIKPIAFARSKENLINKQMEWGLSKEDIMEGDALNQQDVAQVVSKADVVFHTMNIPYQDWEPNLSTILSNVLEECRKQNKPFVYVDNIYSYGLQDSKVTETARKNPHTKKGKLRQRLLDQIGRSNIPYIIAHFPDFYGPHTGNTQLHYTLEQIVNKKSGRFVGKTDIQREFIYIKDGARALVDLALKEEAYGEVWNIPGAGTITGKEIERIASSYLEKEIALKPVHKWMIQAMGLFNPFMKEYVEMMYLNETPVILDGSKYEKIIGPVPKTPYEEGIRETLKFIMENKKVSS